MWLSDLWSRCEHGRESLERECVCVCVCCTKYIHLTACKTEQAIGVKRLIGGKAKLELV